MQLGTSIPVGDMSGSVEELPLQMCEDNFFFEDINCFFYSLFVV